MSDIAVARPAAIPAIISNTRAAVWMAGALIFGFALYYFIGLDESMTSVFGKTLYVHEFVHDARHFLGFPCH